MLTPAVRLFWLGFFGMGLLSVAIAAESSRAAPTRPDAAVATSRKLPLRKFAGVEYVNVADVAAELAFEVRWIERRRKLTLTRANAKAELEADNRDVTINGLRVFLGDPIMDADGTLFVSRVDYERCLTPRLRPGFGLASRPEVKVIALDPGHGGRDTGTSEHEKTFNLDVARRTKKLLESAGFKVVMTRDDDVFLELGQRPAIANLNKADLFISVHFNALLRDTRTSGVEVFTFAPAGQRSTNAWSLGEKDDTEKAAAPVNRFDHWSVVLSQAVHRRLINDLKTFDRGGKLAHWGALRPLGCPGILVECGFLTSVTEARKIATEEYRQKLAEAIAAGAKEYASVVAGR